MLSSLIQFDAFVKLIKRRTDNDISVRKLLPNVVVCQKQNKVLPINRRLSPSFLLFISALISSFQISCTLLGLKPYPNKDLPIYKSQKNIVKQGYAEVPSPYGPIPSIYFGYQRDRNHRPSEYANNKQDVDIIEYKILRKDGSWNWQPYLVFSDDNFDGIADRLFLDSNLDGSLDKIYDIASEGLIINNITFKKIKPWQRKQPIKLPGNSPDRI